MDSEAFRQNGHALVDWIAEYLAHPEKYPVLARVKPGEIAAALPSRAPEEGEPFESIMADFERVLVPGLTHWNHPGFFAYFAITGSAPGVLADFLSAALNQQAMLWRTSPAATELEQVTLGWLRQLIGLPDTFEGVIYDTASIATMTAMVAARETAIADVRQKGLAGRPEVPRMRVYCSDQTHSSIDKAVIAIGLGHESLRRIPTDDRFSMRIDALRAAIAEDRANGILPIAVVPTVGTTSTTSIDPVAEVADICERERLWMHVDAAYGGVAAMLPSHAHVLHGAERADSLVVNPHKWLFTPFDLSAFYTRRMDVVRAAFALTPEYLRTSEPATVKNLMDTGVQLGRRFRSLKLWMILRSFGARELRARLSAHIALAQQLAAWVDAHPDFERLAPVPFSVVCFRWKPATRTLSASGIDAANERIIDDVNQTGEVFLSHTRLRGALALRIAIGHLHTTESHVRRAWDLVVAHAPRTDSSSDARSAV
ncbi:MAG TPA: aminotransferase class I/II-fold pyridoxal phosphate-dependent enzyme [Vicinamibacterales bacterium]|nr:aminotransferase class I/II-fold pyridoxal phosphate-dependent enzyme [Vicinamibacterales bacterium]